MSRYVFLANLMMVGLAALLAAELIHDLAHAHSLPPSPARHHGLRPPTLPEELGEAAAADDRLASYDVIPAKSLFSPTRSEGGPVAVPTAPSPPKPYLVGIILGGQRSLAYLEDPASHRVLGYTVGDAVGGGRVEKITDEEVVISRADGPVVVLLHDPSKPAPVLTAPQRQASPPALRARPQVPPRFLRRPFAAGQR